MKLSRQPSFRRILLLRTILVSIPVLLIGVAVAFRQARITFQESANKNLTESADNKAEAIETTIRALQTSLVAAGETLTLRTGTLEETQQFLENLAPQMPLNVSCLQLADWQTGTPLAGTCDIPFLGSESNQQMELGDLKRQWPKDRITDNTDPFYIHSLDVQTQAAPDTQKHKRSQLNLLLSTPVYDQAGKLRYVLVAQGFLRQRDSLERRSLLGSTVIIDTNGTILSHPLQEQVGKNINDSMDSARFKQIVERALDGDQDVRFLYNFSGSSGRWLAGYSSANISISPTQDETWVVLAVTQLDTALYGLNNIKRIVLMLTGGLILAHLLAMFYMARDLARPIEQLGEYASRIHDPHSSQKVPKDFRIREINQLSGVLDNMVKRLEDRAKELETAWQEAQAANKLKDEILANTSHELRTPLNAIIGCVRLVKDDLCDSPEEEQELLERTDEAAIHLLKIINDILDIAKIESGTSTLSMEDVILDQTIREVIDLQSVEAYQKGLWLVAKPSPSIIVQADPAKLKQVLLNVVHNAIKFAEDGGITIETKVQLGPDPCGASIERESIPSLGDDGVKDWVVVAINDTGIGIDSTQLAKLCEPFYMADGSKTRKYGGTGLGLAISRNLMELMGGRISIHSDGLGKGTTVKVALPVVKVLEAGDPSEDYVDSMLRINSRGDRNDGSRLEFVPESSHSVAIAPPL